MPVPASGDATAGFLAQEYLALQKMVEDFDQKALTIKAWSVTFSAAGLGLAYQQHLPILLLAAACSALAFWLVEAVWKSHQYGYYPRLLEIEEWFRAHSDTAGDAPFQITSQWRPVTAAGGTANPARAIALKRRFIPFFAGVCLPHVIVAAAGVGLFLLYPPVATASRDPPDAIFGR